MPPETRSCPPPRALDNQSQRLVELARDGRQVADQTVGILAHQPASVEIFADLRDQVPPLQERQRLGPLPLAHRHHGWLVGLERFLDLLILQRFQGQQQLAQIALDDVLRYAYLLGCLVEKGRPLPRLAHVKNIHVAAIAPRHAQVVLSVS